MTNPMDRARQLAESASSDPQARNAAWWNELPMTYRSWDADGRTDLTADDFIVLEREFLESNPWFARHYDFSRHAGKRVLEIGCGAGAATGLLAKAGAMVTAVDLAESAVQLTARNCEAQGLRVDLRQMDAEHLTFPDGSFDYVFAWGVLHHTADTEAAYREVARVLRVGGESLTMVYNRMSFRYWVRGLEWLLLRGKLLRRDTLSSVQRFYTDGYYHRHYSSREILAVHQRVGLSPERTSVTHMAKRMTPMVPLAADEWLKRRAGWLLIVEARKL
jgi:SAM-dependent methyltransferase